ncbi:hypothetical protein [Cellulomonas sp. P5_C5]
MTILRRSLLAASLVGALLLLAVAPANAASKVYYYSDCTVTVSNDSNDAYTKGSCRNMVARHQYFASDSGGTHWTSYDNYSALLGSPDAAELIKSQHRWVRGVNTVVEVYLNRA